MQDSQPMAHQRNERGQFIKGHSVNAGRRRRNVLARLRDAVVNEVSPDELAMIVRSQADKALNGDLKAAIFIRDTVIGKPIRQVEDTEDKGKLIELTDLIRAASDAASQ
jgi:hypothetical protein